MFDNQQLAQPAPALSRAKHDATARRQHGKLRQAAKIRELEKVLLTLGYKSAGQRAAVLGLKRSTIWAIFNAEHTRGGLSSNTVKQLLAAQAAPKELIQVIEEYVRKIVGSLWSQSFSTEAISYSLVSRATRIDPATTDHIPLTQMRLMSGLRLLPVSIRKLFIRESREALALCAMIEVL